MHYETIFSLLYSIKNVQYLSYEFCNFLAALSDGKTRLHPFFITIIVGILYKEYNTFDVTFCIKKHQTKNIHIFFVYNLYLGI